MAKICTLPTLMSYTSIFAVSIVVSTTCHVTIKMIGWCDRPNTEEFKE